jgi:peroxiredoxin Q/BCP
MRLWGSEMPDLFEINDILSIVCSLFGTNAPVDKVLGRGDLAPDFELRDQYGAFRRLADSRGYWTVLYFYPRDDTPGCTKEACAFRDGIGMLRSMAVDLFGVSTDSVERHAAFATKYNLPFPLLSDPGGSIARAYGVYRNLGILGFARRRTFIVDPEGRIARIYRRVDTRRHGSQVITDLGALRET